MTGNSTTKKVKKPLEKDHGRVVDEERTTLVSVSRVEVGSSKRSRSAASSNGEGPKQSKRSKTEDKNKAASSTGSSSSSSSKVNPGFSSSASSAITNNKNEASCNISSTVVAKEQNKTPATVPPCKKATSSKKITVPKTVRQKHTLAATVGERVSQALDLKEDDLLLQGDLFSSSLSASAAFDKDKMGGGGKYSARGKKGTASNSVPKGSGGEASPQGNSMAYSSSPASRFDYQPRSRFSPERLELMDGPPSSSKDKTSSGKDKNVSSCTTRSAREKSSNKGIMQGGSKTTSKNESMKSTSNKGGKDHTLGGKQEISSSPGSSRFAEGGINITGKNKGSSSSRRRRGSNGAGKAEDGRGPAAASSSRSIAKAADGATSNSAVPAPVASPTGSSRQRSRKQSQNHVWVQKENKADEGAAQSNNANRGKTKGKNSSRASSSTTKGGASGGAGGASSSKKSKDLLLDAALGFEDADSGKQNTDKGKRNTKGASSKSRDGKRTSGKKDKSPSSAGKHQDGQGKKGEKSGIGKSKSKGGKADNVHVDGQQEGNQVVEEANILPVRKADGKRLNRRQRAKAKDKEQKRLAAEENAGNVAGGGASSSSSGAIGTSAEGTNQPGSSSSSSANANSTTSNPSNAKKSNNFKGHQRDHWGSSSEYNFSSWNKKKPSSGSKKHGNYKTIRDPLQNDRMKQGSSSSSSSGASRNNKSSAPSQVMSSSSSSSSGNETSSTSILFESLLDRARGNGAASDVLRILDEMGEKIPDEIKRHLSGHLMKGSSTTSGSGSSSSNAKGGASSSTASHSQILIGGSSTSASNRWSSVIANLKDPKRQFAALTDLNERLQYCSEDMLLNFPMETAVPALLKCLEHPSGGGGDPFGGGGAFFDGMDETSLMMGMFGDADGGGSSQQMILACRCIYTLIDILPPTTRLVAAEGGISVLVSKLGQIDVIDVAEQVIHVLEKITDDVPQQVLNAGGLLGLLQFLDFFHITLQRKAVSASSKMLSNVKTRTAFETHVRPAIAQMTQLLRHPDAMVRSKICECWRKMLDAFVGLNTMAEMQSATAVMHGGFMPMLACFSGLGGGLGGGGGPSIELGPAAFDGSATDEDDGTPAAARTTSSRTANDGKTSKKRSFDEEFEEICPVAVVESLLDDLKENSTNADVLHILSICVNYSASLTQAAFERNLHDLLAETLTANMGQSDVQSCETCLAALGVICSLLPDVYYSPPASSGGQSGKGSEAASPSTARGLMNKLSSLWTRGRSKDNNGTTGDAFSPSSNTAGMVGGGGAHQGVQAVDGTSSSSGLNSLHFHVDAQNSKRCKLLTDNNLENLLKLAQSCLGTILHLYEGSGSALISTMALNCVLPLVVLFRELEENNAAAGAAQQGSGNKAAGSGGALSGGSTPRNNLFSGAAISGGSNASKNSSPRENNPADAAETTGLQTFRKFMSFDVLRLHCVTSESSYLSYLIVVDSLLRASKAAKMMNTSGGGEEPDDMFAKFERQGVFEELRKQFGDASSSSSGSTGALARRLEDFPDCKTTVMDIIACMAHKILSMRQDYRDHIFSSTALTGEIDIVEGVSGALRRGDWTRGFQRLGAALESGDLYAPELVNLLPYLLPLVLDGKVKAFLKNDDDDDCDEDEDEDDDVDDEGDNNTLDVFGSKESNQKKYDASKRVLELFLREVFETRENISSVEVCRRLVRLCIAALTPSLCGTLPIHLFSATAVTPAMNVGNGAMVFMQMPGMMPSMMPSAKMPGEGPLSTHPPGGSATIPSMASMMQSMMMAASSSSGSSVVSGPPPPGQASGTTNAIKDGAIPHHLRPISGYTDSNGGSLVSESVSKLSRPVKIRLIPRPGCVGSAPIGSTPIFPTGSTLGHSAMEQQDENGGAASANTGSFGKEGSTMGMGDEFSAKGTTSSKGIMPTTASTTGIMPTGGATSEAASFLSSAATATSTMPSRMPSASSGGPTTSSSALPSPALPPPAAPVLTSDILLVEPLATVQSICDFLQDRYDFLRRAPMSMIYSTPPASGGSSSPLKGAPSSCPGVADADPSSSSMTLDQVMETEIAKKHARAMGETQMLRNVLSTPGCVVIALEQPQIVIYDVNGHAISSDTSLVKALADASLYAAERKKREQLQQASASTSAAGESSTAGPSSGKGALPNLNMSLYGGTTSSHLQIPAADVPTEWIRDRSAGTGIAKGGPASSSSTAATTSTPIEPLLEAPTIFSKNRSINPQLVSSTTTSKGSSHPVMLPPATTGSRFFPTATDDVFAGESAVRSASLWGTTFFMEIEFSATVLHGNGIAHVTRDSDFGGMIDQHCLLSLLTSKMVPRQVACVDVMEGIVKEHFGLDNYGGKNKGGAKTNGGKGKQTAGISTMTTTTMGTMATSSTTMATAATSSSSNPTFPSVLGGSNAAEGLDSLNRSPNEESAPATALDSPEGSSPDLSVGGGSKVTSPVDETAGNNNSNIMLSRQLQLMGAAKIPDPSSSSASEDPASSSASEGGDLVEQIRHSTNPGASFGSSFAASFSNIFTNHFGAGGNTGGGSASTTKMHASSSTQMNGGSGSGSGGSGGPTSGAAASSTTTSTTGMGSLFGGPPGATGSSSASSGGLFDPGFGGPGAGPGGSTSSSSATTTAQGGQGHHSHSHSSTREEHGQHGSSGRSHKHGSRSHKHAGSSSSKPKIQRPVAPYYEPFFFESDFDKLLVELQQLRKHLRTLSSSACALSGAGSWMNSNRGNGKNNSNNNYSDASRAISYAPLPASTTAESLLVGKQDHGSKAMSMLESTSASGGDQTTAWESLLIPDSKLRCLLDFLAMLHRISAYYRTTAHVTSSTPGSLQTFVDKVNEGAFVSKCLTTHALRQLHDPVTIAARAHAKWVPVLGVRNNFLFSASAKRAMHQGLHMGLGRAMHYAQQRSGANNSRQQSQRPQNVLAPIPRQKVRISRARLVESAQKLMALYAQSPAILEVEFANEVGTGSGPTLEFYSTVVEMLKEPCCGAKSGVGPNGTDLLCDIDQTTMPSERAPEKRTCLWRTSADGYLFPAPLCIHENPKVAVACFRLLGQLVGKALLDGRLIDLQLHPLFWRLVRGSQASPSFLSVQDLRLVDSELWLSLEKLRAMDDVEALEISFVLPGTNERFELVEGGREKIVTKDSVDQYISLVASSLLYASIRESVLVFREALLSIHSVESLCLFSEEELSNLIVGVSTRDNEFWNKEHLEKHIDAAHGFSKESEVYKNLVALLPELGVQQRKQFLAFVTGAHSLPPTGFAGLKPKLQVARKDEGKNGDIFLPSVMTCANYLKMPNYSSAAILKQKLLQAISGDSNSFLLS